MSDPEVPKNERHDDVDHVVDSANEGLAEAEAARAEVPGPDAQVAPVDPDLAAFEAAEREHPGTFSAAEQRDADAAADRAVQDADRRDLEADRRDLDAERHDVDAERRDVEAERRDVEAERDAVAAAETAEPETTRHTYHADPEHPTVADTAYGAGAATSAETRVVPAEPLVAPAPQPIFVQAPEPPRELGNRGTAAGIGLLATLCFALLYLGTILGLGALEGDVTGENIADAALAPLTTWSFWVPVVVFFLAFWLLGVFINRGRWGLWVIFGLFVAAAAYGGHLLGQLFQAGFWRIGPAASAELVNEQLLAPLAIAAFVFARELTVWFGAWVARRGARKKELNAEAQREYERTLEAGPTLAR
ncbi:MULTISPECIES: ABC transporter [Microbacterium]|uniref:ABC transporter n=1 Tax=Microbacterium TaxID=33882 RepID=UPI00217D2634|nr:MULTISPECIES: ABC transporter [Microbacterium]UWF77205.1 ABC transporter [Microbacterium neungamense]WCM55361.1 ABC transporter [Microbacterium sp. EF45047]